MGQLTNESKYDLAKGFSWHAVINIRATGQPRQKVVFELADKESGDPIFTIELDKKDRLALAVTDRRGRRFETPKIPKAHFEGRFIWLAANIVPRDRQIHIALSINEEAVTADGINTDFSGDVDAISSMGSLIDGTNPASFKVGQIVFINRVLNENELRDLRDYFTSKNLLEL